MATIPRDLFKMADHPNPFLQADFIENELERLSDADRSDREMSPVAERLSLDQVAAKLLKDQFILTALELHTELIESGRELPRLRDFFSNPANFERTKLQADSSPGLRE